jgi:hypothetical protein
VRAEPAAAGVTGDCGRPAGQATLSPVEAFVSLPDDPVESPLDGVLPESAVLDEDSLVLEVEAVLAEREERLSVL